MDQKIQAIISAVFRAVGPALLNSGGLNGILGASRPGGASKNVNDDDDDDDDDFSAESVEQNKSGRKVSISLPTFAPGSDEDEDDDDEIETNDKIVLSSTTTTTTTTASSVGTRSDDSPSAITSNDIKSINLFATRFGEDESTDTKTDVVATTTDGDDETDTLSTTETDDESTTSIEKDDDSNVVRR